MKNYFGKDSLSHNAYAIINFFWYMFIIGIILSLISLPTIREIRGHEDYFILNCSSVGVKLREITKIPVYYIVMTYIKKGIWGYYVWELRKIFRNFTLNEIFKIENFISIKRIGFMTLIYSFYPMILEFANTVFLVKNYKGKEIVITFENGPDLILVFVSIGIILFAEVLKKAIEYKEDSDLTV